MANFFRRLFRRNALKSDIVADAPPVTPTIVPTPPEALVMPTAALPLQTPIQVEQVAQAAGAVAYVILPSASAEPTPTPVAVPDATPLPTVTVNGVAYAQDDLDERALRDRATFGDELWGIANGKEANTTDAEKLARLGLPLLLSEQDVADLLGIPLNRLRWFTFDRAADTTWHYVRRVVPKRSGGERVILAPKQELKALQRKVLSDIVGRAPVALAAHGFVPGKSTITNARQHVGKAVVLKLDLQDFFPSITFARVRGLLIALGYAYAVASTLALLCTEYDREEYTRDGTRYFISVGPRHLVQGAPTSPTLANLVSWQLDRRLTGLAGAFDFTYTRYADDLVFSGDNPDVVQKLRFLTERIIRDEHFTVNRKKTRVARQSARQIVTGLVVNEAVATPRDLRRTLRAILHHAEKEGLAQQNREGRKDYPAYLQGMIAYVNAASPRHAAVLRTQLGKLRGQA
ncbi:MAG: RNA-directed DNA polymerase [Ktedonobacterales bacterium]|nr:RNA-directed DNA polymerase [Ktedonobacterales bacterium]